MESTEKTIPLINFLIKHAPLPEEKLPLLKHYLKRIANVFFPGQNWLIGNVTAKLGLSKELERLEEMEYIQQKQRDQVISV